MQEQDLLVDLTPSQQEAVRHIDGPMLVVAGAGSGKTRVVTHRIAWLMQHGVFPDHILTMTFTNKAAGEMKARVQSMTGVAPRWMGTFHSICAQLLRRWLDAYDIDPRTSRFTIYDTEDQKKIIKNLLKQHGLDEKKGPLSVAHVMSAISAIKSSFLSPKSVTQGVSRTDADLQMICEEYEQTLKTANALDFDDLLWVTVKMFLDNPQILHHCQEHFQYIMVDEYQDTNHVQYLLLKLLAGEKANLHVTGDPDQSIYSWRGALYRNIMEFTEDYPKAKVVRLERNYRSSGHILQVANALISHNFNRIEKKLYTEDPLGELITLGTFWGDREEASWVVENIMQQQLKGLNLGDIAIFYRTNAQSRAIEDALIRNNIPYQIIGGIRFYERKEVRDFIGYLRLLAVPEDFLAFDRVLGSRSFGVGKVSLNKLQDLATSYKMPVVPYLLTKDLTKDWSKPPAKILELVLWLKELFEIKKTAKDLPQMIDAVLKHSGLVANYQAELIKEKSENNRKKGDLYPSEERMKNLESFVEKAREFSGEDPVSLLDDFLAEVALNSSTDDMQDFREKVTLMTLHCSKGLEFPCVFITGLEQGLLPHVNSFAKGERDVEEERRLLYVGITRAEKKLYLSMASSRYNYGSVKTSSPSQFIKELPRECLEFVGVRNTAYGTQTQEYDRMNQRFAMGNRSSSYSNHRPIPMNNQQWLAEKRRLQRKTPHQEHQENYYDTEDFD